MSKKKDNTPCGKTKWTNLVVFPAWVGFCPDEKSWNKCMNHFGVTGKYLQSGGMFTPIDKEGRTLNGIITIAPAKGKTRLEEIGLIIHECVHMWQWTLDKMNEPNPGREIEAYTLQRICMDMIQAFDETRGLPKK